MRCPKDIDTIDFDVIDNTDRPPNFSIGDQFLINIFAQLRRQLFGVLEFFVPEPLRQNNRSCDYWSGERPASGFIDSGDAADSDCAQFFLVSKTASPVHGFENTEKLKI